VTAADRALALTIMCPICDAPVGEECVDPFRRTRKRPHQFRIDVAVDGLDDIAPNAGSTS
jgi:hypothetical protein